MLIRGCIMHGTNGSGLLDWNDARIFLAVARHGSLRAAGRALGISQPTIGRRIAASEAVFGGPTLFDRLPEGLRLNEAGAALLPVAEQLEDAALSLERHRAAASSVLSGTVRISVGEGTVARLGVMPRWLLADADRWRLGSAARSRGPACRCRRGGGVEAVGRPRAGTSASAATWPCAG